MTGERAKLVVFRVDEQRYGFALESVERVLPMVAVAPLPAGPAPALGVINLRGQIVPVVDVRRRLGLPPREYGPSAQLLLARTARWVLALPVDEVEGVIDRPEEVSTPSPSLLPPMDHLAGIAPLDDDLLFVHDIEAFFSAEEERQLAQALDTLEAPVHAPG